MVPDPSSPSALPEPLGLPRGSVRGLLAVFVAATFGYLLVNRTTPVPPVILNSIIVVVAFYFGGGGRSLAASSGAVSDSKGPDTRGRRAMQALLLVAFAGITGWLVRETPSVAAIPPELQGVWLVLGGYLVGLSLSWIFHRRADASARRRKIAIVFRNVNAVMALGLTAAICIAIAIGQPSLLAGRSEEALSLIITFYFGSRVIR